MPERTKPVAKAAALTEEFLRAYRCERDRDLLELSSSYAR